MAVSRKGINSKRNQPIEFLVKFGNAYESWKIRGEISQVEAAKMCGVSTPTFTKYADEWYQDVILAIGRGDIAREG